MKTWKQISHNSNSAVHRQFLLRLGLDIFFLQTKNNTGNVIRYYRLAEARERIMANLSFTCTDQCVKILAGQTNNDQTETEDKAASRTNQH